MAETPYTAPQGATIWQKLGPGGLASLVLAGLGALLLVPVWIQMRRVLKGAQGEPAQAADLILILGRKLKQNQATPVFEARLAHGLRLWQEGWGPRILVAGGRTGQASLSEGEVGKAWLCARGVPDEVVLVEDQSQHTLENFFHVRRTLREMGWTHLLLVTDPLHLMRASALARGLGLGLTPSGARACPPSQGSFGWYGRALREAFFLHWYYTGRVYSRLTRSKRQLERIT